MVRTRGMLGGSLRGPFCACLAMMAVSGCTVPLKQCEPNDPGPAARAPGECHLALNAPPLEARAGESFSLNVSVECPYQWSSSEVGAWFRKAARGNPGPEECASHADAWNVTPHPATSCTIPDPGAYFIRGHATIGNETLRTRECSLRITEA